MLIKTKIWFISIFTVELKKIEERNIFLRYLKIFSSYLRKEERERGGDGEKLVAPWNISF